MSSQPDNADTEVVAPVKPKPKSVRGRGPPARFAAAAAARRTVDRVTIVTTGGKIVCVPISAYRQLAESEDQLFVPLAQLRDYSGSSIATVDELVANACYYIDPPRSAVSPARATGSRASGVHVGFASECLGHVCPRERYPERPQRVLHAAKALIGADLLNPDVLGDDGEVTAASDADPPPAPCESVTTGTDTAPGDAISRTQQQQQQPRPASRLASWEEIAPIHGAPEYKAFCDGSTVSPFDDACSNANDLYISEDGATRVAALAAAASCIDATAAVIEAGAAEDSRSAGQTGRAFCLVRPPGHHCAEQPSAFCVINNVMVAVAAAANNPRLRAIAGPSRRPRLAIVDIDVHHGNGTQKLADEWNRREDRMADVLFVSVHRYDNGTFFPGTGSPDGLGPAGLNLNFAFNTARKRNVAHVICDDTFDVIDWHVLRPLLVADGAFPPDLVFVSCGFDAAEGDQLGGMGVVRGFHRMARSLTVNCPTSIGTVAVLEGGYNIEAIANATVRVVSALAHVAADPGPSLPAMSWVQQAVQDWSPSDNADEKSPLTMPDDVHASTLLAIRWRHRSWALQATLITARLVAESPGTLQHWAADVLVPRLEGLLAAVENREQGSFVSPRPVATPK